MITCIPQLSQFKIKGSCLVVKGVNMVIIACMVWVISETI